MSSQHRHASAAPAAASSSSAVAVAASSTAARAGGHAASSTASQATGHGGGGGRSSVSRSLGCSCVLAPGLTSASLQSHPEYVWYGILALLALATIANACYLSWVTYRRYRARRGASASSKATSADGAGGVSLRRVPQAVLTASRIFGFRWRIPGLELMIVEALFTVAYVGACLVWCFAPGQSVQLEIIASCSPLSSCSRRRCIPHQPYGAVVGH